MCGHTEKLCCTLLCLINVTISSKAVEFETYTKHGTPFTQTYTHSTTISKSDKHASKATNCTVYTRTHIHSKHSFALENINNFEKMLQYIHIARTIHWRAHMWCQHFIWKQLKWNGQIYHIKLRAVTRGVKPKKLKKYINHLAVRMRGTVVEFGVFASSLSG